MQLSDFFHTNPTYFISVKIIKYRWIVDLILGINFTFTNYQLMRFFLCVENITTIFKHLLHYNNEDDEENEQKSNRNCQNKIDQDNFV